MSKATNDIKDMKIGDKITAVVCGTTLIGVITGFGNHKGREVIDIRLIDNSERFVYPSQIIN